MTDLQAPITEVTVYPDRALVNRAGSLSLAAGVHEVRILDLPELLRDSLRASGHGPQGARILEVDLTTTFHSHPLQAELLALQATCEQLRQRIALLQVHLNALRDRRQWVRSLGEHTRDFARGLANGQMQAQACLDLLTLTMQEAQRDAEAGLNVEEEVKQVQSELAARERELASKQGSQQSDRLAVVVTVEMPEEGTFRLEVSYLVTQASWKPLYDVRVNLEENGNQGTVSLTYNALVQQATGEDWKQVHLTLSTARPNQAAVLPKLNPRYLHAFALPMGGEGSGSLANTRSLRERLVPGQQQETNRDGVDRREITIATEADEPEMPVLAEIATATTRQSGAACFFTIKHAVDIPSDNTPHKTTIAHDDLPCTIDYVSAPALDPVAHLRATIVNTTQNVLLPGASSIFLHEDYVGTTHVQMTAPREEFQLFLGIDDTIKITHELLERTVEKGALLQVGLRRIQYTYRITVANYAPFARQMVLRDQLPVSQHERIKVKLLSIQPPPSERSQLELVSWTFSLAANGHAQVDYRYAVEHPQDLQVSGLA